MKTHLKKVLILLASGLLVSDATLAVENSTDCNVLVIKAPQGAIISADEKKTWGANILKGSSSNVIALQRKGYWERGGGGYTFPMESTIEVKKDGISYKAYVAQTYCLFQAGAVTVRPVNETSGNTSDMSSYRVPNIQHPKLNESAGKIEFPA